jgi:hypothetical protein
VERGQTRENPRVTAVSSVGFYPLGQNERWTEKQTALINKLATEVESSSGSDVECKEVAEALRRSIHRIGLRQGVLRIFAGLGLEHLRKEWDRVYAARSGLFHGTLTLTEEEILQLAIDAITLCGRIILAAAERDGVKLASIRSVHLPPHEKAT